MITRLLIGLFAGSAVLLVTAPPASAHAVLVSTNPGDQAHLDQAPAEVTLEFSERISTSLGAVRVFDRDSRRVDEGDVSTDGTVVTVGLRGGLGDGAYIVTWRAVSADSHPVKGAFTFSVGNITEIDAGLVASLFDSGEDRPWEIAGAFARWLAYGGTLLAAGGVCFLVLAHDGGPERRILSRIVVGAAIVGVTGVVLVLPIQAALATGLGLTSITKAGVVDQVLGDGVGWSSLLTIAGLAAAVGGSVTARVRSLALAGAALAAGSFVLAGHTTETSPAWLTTPADVVHLLTAAAWFGGVVLLAITMRARREGDAVATGRIVARFSRVAAVSIVAVGAAGAALAWSEVRAVRALTDTTYGRLLIVKVLVVVPIAAAGAYNHFRLVPALEKAPKKAGARLAKTVRVEALAMIGVLALTAALVNVTPARTAAGLTGPFSEFKPLGDGQVNLVVSPNRAGTNSLHLYLLDRSGRSLDPEVVELDLSLPANQIGPITRKPFAAGPGHYQLDGGDLSIAGDWQIDVRAAVDEFTSHTTTFTVTVNP